MQLVSSKHWDTLLSALFPWGHHLEALPVCAAWRCGVRISTGTGGVQRKHHFMSWHLDIAEIFLTRAMACCIFGNITRKSFKDVSSLLLALPCLFRAKERRWSFNNLEQFWYPMALPYNFRTLYRLGGFCTFYHFLEIFQEHVELIWISMEKTETSLDFATKFFETGKKTPQKTPKNICKDCNGLLVYLFHIWGRMSLIANTKLVRVLCKHFSLILEILEGRCWVQFYSEF